eukprot:2057361-Prymnesium_polylepis.2
MLVAVAPWLSADTQPDGGRDGIVRLSEAPRRRDGRRRSSSVRHHAREPLDCALPSWRSGVSSGGRPAEALPPEDRLLSLFRPEA